MFHHNNFHSFSLQSKFQRTTYASVLAWLSKIGTFLLLQAGRVKTPMAVEQPNIDTIKKQIKVLVMVGSLEATAKFHSL